MSTEVERATNAEAARGPDGPRAVLMKLGVVLTLLCGAWACALSSRADVDVQEWWLSRGPVVPHDSFPADCSLCHAGDDWQTIEEDFEFDHLAQTGVELEGAHARAECLRCHNDRGPAGVFAARGCAGCHGDVHTGKLGGNCVDCHGQEDWRPEESIALHNRTGFALVGSHAAAACWRCHPGADQALFSGADTECVSCHGDDLALALSPDHAAQGWVSGCDRCHIPTSWTGAGFNHSSYALVGTHRTTDCVDCHVGDVFAGLPRDCVDCHLGQYQASSDPDHDAAGFPTSCETCHVPTTWSAAVFDHGSWLLTGSHGLAACSDCHGGGVFAGTPQTCLDCHGDDYSGTTDPDHVGGGYPTDCESCHNTTAWEPAGFDHLGWPLTGAHTMTDCIECHAGGVFAGTPGLCYDCHANDFTGTDDPDHVASGFPTTCDDCHNTTTWERANFDHLGWPLTGTHAATDCIDCHAGGVFEGTPSLCADCHLAEYQASTDPHHQAAGFDLACESCHDTTSWQGAVYGHSTWRLTGAHSGADCSTCHQGGVYPGLPNACVDCHLQEFQSANDPNHVSAGFPQTCDSCHSTVTWQGATFDHSFPIDKGDHKNLACAECHVIPRNFADFSCTHCHQHNRSDMAQKHDEVRGYLWLTSACYGCHMNGEE